MKIRTLVDEDLPQIQQIYAYHVLHGTGSWEWEPPSLAEMTARAQFVQEKKLPYLVAEVAEQIAGYAYASLYRPRAGYRFTLEDSVYLHPEFSKQGIGLQLLQELLAQCGAQGYREMIAVIGDSANLASIRLHERAGFVEVGVFRNIGFKFGRYLDSVYMQAQLNAP
ncbi:MAG: GNAT family N-acetyltransferase [Deltaproteobacteria bacterium]